MLTVLDDSFLGLELRKGISVEIIIEIYYDDNSLNISNKLLIFE